jgi:GntR family transcriptional regulator, transcriptional repressor for pyruvate dehydrogenase complex
MASVVSSLRDDDSVASELPRRIHIPKASEIVANAIRREIVRGTLREGDFLPTEAKLIERFGISRPTLREALRVLESEMLIVLHKGTRGGARVCGPQLAVAGRYGGSLLQAKGASVQDVLDAQNLLECNAVRLLAERHSAEAIGALRAALDEEEHAIGNLAAFTHCAVRFHSWLIEATGNEAFVLLAGMLHEVVERHVELVAAREPATRERPKWQSRSHEVHTVVVDLIAKGDADGAELMWRKHLNASQRVMAKRIDVQSVLELFE